MAHVIEEIPRVEKRALCPHCGRTIGYVQNEVRDYKTYDYGGGCDIVYYIVCPAPGCGKDITIRRY